MTTRTPSMFSKGLPEAILRCAALHFEDVGLKLSFEREVDSRGNTFTVGVTLHGSSSVYRSVFKRIRNAAQLSLLHDEFARHAMPSLLLTDYLSRDMAQAARRLGIEFLDAAGNAYLRVDGNVIWSIGNKRGWTGTTFDEAATVVEPLDASARFAVQPPPANTGTLAATGILFVMLMAPVRFGDLTQRDLASMAGVGVGTVSAVLAAFEARGWVCLTERTGAKTGRRGRLLEPDLLLQEFAVNYAARLRNRLVLRRFDVSERLARALPTSIPGILWGGEVAAELLLGGFHPANYSLYVDAQRPDALRDLVSTYRLRPAENGRVIVMAKFWHGSTPYDDACHVPPALIFAELMSQATTRGVERAALVKTRWLTHDCVEHQSPNSSGR